VRSPLMLGYYSIRGVSMRAITMTALAILSCCAASADAAGKRLKSRFAQEDPQNPSYTACLYGIDDKGIGGCAPRVRRDARYLCDVPLQTMGHDICDLHSNAGVSSTRYTFPPVTLNNNEGGQCGYSRFQFTCHFSKPMVSVLEGYVYPGCTNNYEPAVQSFCARARSSTYRFFAAEKGPGFGSCGSLKVRAICY